MEFGGCGARSVRMSKNMPSINVQGLSRRQLRYARKWPERSVAAGRSIESGLHTVKKLLEPGPERQTPRTEEAESVPWTDGRPGKSHLGNPGEEEDSSCQESESKDAIRHGGLG